MIGGSRQAHYEKVAQGRRNEALLANRAAVEDVPQQIARIRQRQAEATSDNAILARLTTCRLSKGSFAELEEFLRCYSVAEKQIVSEWTWNCLAKGRSSESVLFDHFSAQNLTSGRGHRGCRSCAEAGTSCARPCSGSASVRTWRTRCCMPSRTRWTSPS